MSHLNSERLAALVDETPTPIESAHITTCDACSHELVAQRKLARMAAAAGPVTDGPISSFDALVPRLRAEGLVAVSDRRAVITKWTIRVAASFALVAAGAFAGRLTMPAQQSSLAQGGSAGAPANGTTSAPSFQTTDDAVRAMSSSQQMYSTAAAYLAAQDTTSHFVGLNESTYRTRLAALDEILSTTRTALYQAPQDPVLNQYYQGTLSQRQATLTQLRGLLPVAARKGSY